MNKSAKEMFEELGYEYNYDDGFIEFLKGEPVPDRINTNYIAFKKLAFNKLEEELSIYEFETDPLCQKRKKRRYSIYLLNKEELQAINQQCKELGWFNGL